MSHTAPDDPKLKRTMENSGLPMTHETVIEEGPALTDAKRVLLIVLAGIAAFAAIVHLFVF
jgi:hypothetical protein